MRGWWYRDVVEPGKLPLLLALLSFVVTFLVTRTITRLIRAGKGPFKNNVTASGIHIHHSVPGIVLLIVGALGAVAASSESPWRGVAAIGVGVGASLVLDEFAMILHLEDVYWTEEGRASVQAVALVSACLLLGLVGMTPFGVNDVDPAEQASRWSVVSGTLFTMAMAAICALKGKYRLALVAIFVPPVAYVGAMRVARPGSPWDKRRYRKHPARRARAVRRTEAFDRRWGPGFPRPGGILPRRPADDEPAPGGAGDRSEAARPTPPGGRRLAGPTH